MITTIIITLIHLSNYLSGQEIETADHSAEYIQDYYSLFDTGYNFDGQYITLSDNYKAVFSDSIFTLTFDRADENEILQKQTITINLKDVVTIEPNGTDVVEILENNPLFLPICGKLVFNTASESYEINIYYEVDEDVERTQIYKAFKNLIEIYKN